MSQPPAWKGELDTYRWLEDCNVLQVGEDRVLVEFPHSGRTWMEWVPKNHLVGYGGDLAEDDCHVSIGVSRSWANSVGLPD